MKISLVIESDSVEEFRAALATLMPAGGSDKEYLAAVAARTASVVRDLEKREVTSPPDTFRPDTQEETAPAEAPAAAEAPPATMEPPVKAKKPRGRKPKAEGGEAPPTTTAPYVEVAPATPAKQASPKSGAIGVTRDDLMAIFSRYVQKYGTNFGYTDVSKMLTDTFGPGVRKSSDVTDDNLAKAVAVVSHAIEANPFARKRADVN